MKILIITGCIYAENCNRTSFTGLDYVVGEIVETIGAIHDVDVFTFTPYPPTAAINNGRIFSYSYGRLVRHIFNDNIKKIAIINSTSDFSTKSRVKAMRSILVADEIEKLCLKEKYDIIHVHGLGFPNYLIAEISLSTGIPVLYTLHGLLGYGAPNIPLIDKKSEHRILEILKNNSHIVTCVSSGVKEIICSDMKLNKNNVYVINNAVHMPLAKENAEVLNFIQKDNRKIIVSIGTVSKRKNQIQLVRAYSNSPQWVKKEFLLVLAGRDDTDGEIIKYIEENNLENDVILTGFISKEELAALYEISSFNVMLSNSEGFGLSMIEAASYGIPTLAFSDLDAIKDIYSEKSMYLIKKHDDQSVIDSLVEMLKSDWNRKEIKETVTKFTSKIYLQYIKIYEMIINKNLNKFTSNDIDWRWLNAN